MNGRVARDMFPFYRTCLPALLPLIYFPFFFLFEKKNSLQLAFRYASFLFSFKIRLSYLVTLFSLDTSPRKGERVGRRPPEKFPAFFFFFFFLELKDAFVSTSSSRPTFHDNILQPIEIISTRDHPSRYRLYYT